MTRSGARTGQTLHRNQDELGLHLSSGKSPGYCNLFRRFWWLSPRFFLLLSSCLQSIHLSTQRLLAFIYLLPVIVMAMHYGSTVGVLTSFASALAAAYFCFPPKFSFFISDPLNVAELGFFLLLAVMASKAVAVVTKDDRVTTRPKSPLIGWWRRQRRSPEHLAH